MTGDGMEDDERRVILRICAYGILTWLVPFLIAVPFYSPDGILLTSPEFFKSIMVVSGAAVGAILLVRLFRPVRSGYLRLAGITGIVWLIINWILDLLILLPMNGLPVGEYLSGIGIRYLSIMVMALMAGYIAADASSSRP